MARSSPEKLAAALRANLKRRKPGGGGRDKPQMADGRADGAPAVPEGGAGPEQNPVSDQN